MVVEGEVLWRPDREVMATPQCGHPKLPEQCHHPFDSIVITLRVKTKRKKTFTDDNLETRDRMRTMCDISGILFSSIIPSFPLLGSSV